MPGEAEITHFDDAVLGEEDVLRLDVAVDAVVDVAVVDRLQYLPYDAHRQRKGHAGNASKIVLMNIEALLGMLLSEKK